MATCWLVFCCVVSGALFGWAMRDIAERPPETYTTGESFKSGDSEYTAAFMSEPASSTEITGLSTVSHLCFVNSDTGISFTWRARSDGSCWLEDAP